LLNHPAIESVPDTELGVLAIPTLPTLCLFQQTLIRD